VNTLVTFDLDSTLADTRWRRGMIQPDGGTDWRAYALACPQDTLVTSVASLWGALRPHHSIWVVSGRHVAARDASVRWLLRHQLQPSGVVLMDPGDGRVTDTDHCAWKVGAIQSLARSLGKRHVLHVDDYPPVGRACQAAGLECLIVTPPQILEKFEGEGGYV